MVKVWGKLFKGDKMVKTAVVEVDEKTCTFFDMLRQVSEKLDIPTPVLLVKHVNDFNQFNMCMFAQGDFIDKIHYSRFILENISGGD